MNVYKWVLLSIFALGALSTVAGIGKRRTPSTPGLAVCVLLVIAAEAWLVVLA